MTTVREEQTSFRWDRLTFASAMGYCLLVAGLSVGVVLGELRTQFALSGFVAALHGSTFGIGLLIAGMGGVAFVERVGRRQALHLAVAGLLVGVVMFCLGPAWPITLTGTAITGISGALLVMIMPGLISDHHGDHRAEAFAAVNGAPGLAGVAFSLVIGAALSARWSWRGPYLALTAAIGFVLVLVARPVAIPEGARRGGFSLAHFRDRDRVLIPWLFIVNAVLTEFSVGIWATTYLKEIGGASSGRAPMLAAAFGITMFGGRLVLPTTLRLLGAHTIRVSFIFVGVGALLMFSGPGLAVRVVGLAVVGFAGAPLYPLTVDRLYRRADGVVDSDSLGAIGALASGAAVTIGPLALGLLADRVGLDRAILIIPALSVLGAITQGVE